MPVNWYTSVLKRYQDINLTGFQKEVLKRCIEIDPTVYDIKKNLEGYLLVVHDGKRRWIRDVEELRKYRPSWTTKELKEHIRDRTLRGKVNYKLVHQSVKKLEKLGFVKKASDRYEERGKIRYKLSELGIFYLLHHRLVYLRSFYNQETKSYEDSSLTTKIFLYPIFELETLKNATLDLDLLLQNYLQRCCMACLEAKKEEHHFYGNNEWFMDDLLDKKIRAQAALFAFDVLVYKAMLPRTSDKKQKAYKEWANQEWQNRQDALKVLAHDETFMRFLNGVVENIQDGFNLMKQLKDGFLL